MQEGPDYLKPSCPYCGYSLAGLVGSVCPECGRSLLGRGGSRSVTRPMIGAYACLGASLAISSITGTAMARAGMSGFLLALAFASVPYALALALVRFVGKPRSVFEAFLVTLPSAVVIAAYLIYWYHDSMIVHPDAQGGLVFVFAPLYAVPYAIAAWLAGFIVALFIRTLIWRPRPGR